MYFSTVAAILALLVPSASATYYNAQNIPCLRLGGDITCNLIGNLLPNSVGTCNLDWLGIAGTCSFSCDTNFEPVYTNSKLTSCVAKKCNTTACPVPDDKAIVSCSSGSCDYSCPSGYTKGCNGIAGCTQGSCKAVQTGCSCQGRYCPGISNALVQSTCGADGGCNFVCNPGYSKSTVNGVVQCVQTSCLGCGTADCKSSFDLSNPGFNHAVFYCKDSSTCDYSCPSGSVKTCNGRQGCFSSCTTASAVPARRRLSATVQRKRDLQAQVELALKSGPSSVDGTWGQVLCPKTHQSCSIPGSPSIWECVDTKNDFNSCGGCTGANGKGTDCESLPGVLHTMCGEGKCIIRSCTSMYRLHTAADGTTECVLKPTLKSKHTSPLSSI